MNEERKKILDKINGLIDKRKTELLQRFPYIHEIEDGIIIRFFTDWDNCDDNNAIKYKTIKDNTNPENVMLFSFTPKGTKLEVGKRDYVRSIVCLSGEFEITVNNSTHRIGAFEKTILDTDTFGTYALLDTYAITSSML